VSQRGPGEGGKTAVSNAKANGDVVSPFHSPSFETARQKAQGKLMQARGGTYSESSDVSPHVGERGVLTYAHCTVDLYRAVDNSEGHVGDEDFGLEKER
jgi:hypothetical protein